MRLSKHLALLTYFGSASPLRLLEPCSIAVLTTFEVFLRLVIGEVIPNEYTEGTPTGLAVRIRAEELNSVAERHLDCQGSWRGSSAHLGCLAAPANKGLSHYASTRP